MAAPRSTPDTTAPGPAQQQPRETAVAFEAFRTYLEQGPKRSLSEVGRALGKSKTLMDRWSSRWQWVQRVREFEAEATRVVDAEHLDALAARARRQAEIAQLHGDATLVVPREILRRLGDPVVAQEALAKLTPAELLALGPQAARAHNRAVITERLALGMTTDQGGEAVPRAQAEELARRLTDSELEEKLGGVDELADRRAKKGRAA